MGRTKAQEGQGACPRSHSWAVTSPKFEPLLLPQHQRVTVQLRMAGEMASVLPQLPGSPWNSHRWLSEEQSVSRWLVLVEMCSERCVWTHWGPVQSRLEPVV